MPGKIILKTDLADARKLLTPLWGRDHLTYVEQKSILDAVKTLYKGTAIGNRATECIVQKNKNYDAISELLVDFEVPQFAEEIFVEERLRIAILIALQMVGTGSGVSMDSVVRTLLFLKVPTLRPLIEAVGDNLEKLCALGFVIKDPADCDDHYEISPAGHTHLLNSGLLYAFEVREATEK